VERVWFESLTGFEETDGAGVVDRFREDGPFLESMVNGRRMRRGDFSVVALADLRHRRDEGDPLAYVGETAVSEVIADVRELHADPAAVGATFQVASQFNMLEMISPKVTPEAGIDLYELDRTQGPACAVACGAGTIHRNYFVPFGDGDQLVRGQTADRQLDGFADLAAALELDVDMRNGYALLTPEQLERSGERLNALTEPQRDELAGLLRVGVQADSEVTWRDAGHTVTQVFCSALPIAYAGGQLRQWEPLARLVLDAAYEATFAAAVRSAARSGNRTLYLTLLGAGAFGNPVAWVVEALQRSLRLHRYAGLDVRVVSYGRSQPALRVLDDEAPSWADPLFRDRPAQWGMRGDPHLWRELHAALRAVTPEPTSRAELANLLASKVFRLAGVDVRSSDDRPVRIPRFPSAGMSGGYVAPAFWRDVAVPLLLDRWAEAARNDRVRNDRARDDRGRPG
jgi:hypothetical protein